MVKNHLNPLNHDIVQTTVSSLQGFFQLPITDIFLTSSYENRKETFSGI